MKQRLKKWVAIGAITAMAGLSTQCLAYHDSMNPTFADLETEGYCCSRSTANLAPHWALLGLGVIAVIAIIVKNNTCDNSHTHSI